MDEADAIIEKHKFWNFSIATIFEDYGWYILLIGAALVCVYRKYQPAIDQYFKEQSDKEYAAKYHKDPDLAVARLAAQEAAVRKLQQKYSKDAEDYNKKMEEKESKKREEWLAKQTQSCGQVLGSSPSKNADSLKPEYNPLMGGSSSHSYRPQRRSACSGGGCGR